MIYKKSFLCYNLSKEGYVMKNFFRYLGLGILSFLLIVYLMFLVIPFFLTGVANSYSSKLTKIIEDTSGFSVKLEGIKILTTPKLTAGLYAGHVEVALPNGDKFIMADNLEGKISLIPLLLKKVEVDMVASDNLNVNLKVKKDGKFIIEDYIPKSEKNDDATVDEVVSGLPYGFKLSNSLPDIKINNYNISFIDATSDKSYSISGAKFYMTDFVLNKKVKISSLGQIMLDDRVQFNYNVNLYNKVMPNLDLNELVFSSEQNKSANTQNLNVNIIDIFKNLYKNNVCANLTADIKTTGTFENIHIKGFADTSDIKIAVKGKTLPSSNVDLKFNANKIDIYSKLYTAENEVTEFIGNIKHGKSVKLDLNCKSNAKFNSIIRIIDSIAESFNIYDFNTLSATGGVDADFSLKSNLKKVESSGYIKVIPSSLNYKLYNVSVDDIKADIDLSNNMIDIKNAGLSILGHSLKMSGTITNDANADLSIIADKLQIKGLLTALGQFSLLKDNDLKSGTLSLNTTIKGRLDKLVPNVKLSVENLNIKNIPSNILLKAPLSTIDILADNKKMSGTVKVSDVNITNPLGTISLPNGQVTIGEKDVIIDSADVYFNKSKISITGKIENYLQKTLNIDVKANGSLLASDLKSLLPPDYQKMVKSSGSLPLSVLLTGDLNSQNVDFALNANSSNYLSLLNVSQLNGKNTSIKGSLKISGDTLRFSDTGIFANNQGLLYLKGSVNDLYKIQNLDLNISIPSKISMEIPGLQKSKMDMFGEVSLSGALLNPYLSGNIEIPIIKIDSMLLNLNDMSIFLNGPILKGKGTLMKFVSGGIVAENLASDFSFTNNVFYLKNITGDAFDGKISGNISYNILNGFTCVKLKGSEMDAQKAIAGSAGIKNALSGKLNFGADVNLSGATDVEMIKNLKGKADFEIKDGTLLNIGRFENFLFAQNLQSNSVIKAAVNSISSLPTIKNTAEFKTISGNLSFNNGWATLNPVKLSGPSMAYYITGKYNILNSTANVIVLGRISSDVVSLLGPLGELSVTKLTSYIPKFGALTGNIINSLTSDPKNEKVANIPQLSSGNPNYKDFKVVFNGGVESKSSVKSFKWLSKCDTSAIEKPTLKEQVVETKQAVKDAVQQKVDDINAKLQSQSQSAQEANQQMKDAVQGLKNLFKNNNTTDTKQGS